MSRGPVVISRDDLAHAWAAAFDEITQRGTDEIVPLVVCITGFDGNNAVNEDATVRELVDDALASARMQSIRTVANTIFPQSLWNPQLPAGALFERYSRISGKLRRYRANRNGIYFERMISFQPKGCETPFNQLEYIFATREGGNRRRSAYQISLIDPTHDDTDQYRRGFPCLQQVSITPIGDDQLAVTGLYATQTMFERAYGNYVGLCDLGRFFAHYWNRQLVRVTCVAALAELDITKTEARALATETQTVIAARVSPASIAVEG